MGRAPWRGVLLALFLLPPLLVLSSAPTALASPYHLMQRNETCGSSPCSLTNVTSTIMAAQSFVASDGYNLTRVSLHLAVGSVTPGPITVMVASDVGGVPGSVLGSTTNSTTSASPVWLNFTYSPRIPLTAGITYWIVASTAGTVTYRWTISGSDTYPAGSSATGSFVGGWVLQSKDQWFRIYGYVDSRIVVAKAVDRSKAQVGDILRYRIHFDNTGNLTAPSVWINDTLPPQVTYLSDTSSSNGGTKTGNYNWTFVNVAQGSHSFEVVVKVNDLVPPGTSAVNRATLDYLNSTGKKQARSSAQASTIIGLKTKTLYLHEAGNIDNLDTKKPSNTFNCNNPPPAPPAPIGDGCDYDQDGDRGISIKRGGFTPGDPRTYHDWVLSPAFAKNFTIYTYVNVSLWLDDKGSGGPEVAQVDLYRNDSSAYLMTLTFAFTADTTVGFQQVSVNATGVLLGFTRGARLLVRVTVPSASKNDLQLAYDSTLTDVKDAFQSRLTMETPTYISLDSVATYDRVGRTGHFTVNETALFRATVSDPLGSYDIVNTGTRLDIFSPSSGLAISYTMVLEATDPSIPSAWKLFNYSLLIPESSPQGDFTARVTGTERNLVTAYAYGTFDVHGPVIVPVKRVAEASARPGDTLHYKIFFNNTGTVTAVTLWINDTLSASVTYLNDSAPANRTGQGRWVFRNVVPGPHFLTLNATLNRGIAGTAKVFNVVKETLLDNKGYVRGPKAANATTLVAGPYLALVMVGSPTYVDPRGNITYQIYFNNTGNDPAAKVWINDTLPSTIQFISSSAAREPSYTGSWIQGSVIHFNFTSVGPGTHNFTLIAAALANPPGGTVITNTAIAAYVDLGGSHLGPSWAAATSYIVGPKLALGLTVIPSSSDPGARVLMRLAYDNRGQGVTPAYNALIALDFGPHVVLVNASPGATYNSSTHRLRWFFPVVYAGETGVLWSNGTLLPGTPDATRVTINATGTFSDGLGNAMPQTRASGGFMVTAPRISLLLMAQDARVASGALSNYTAFFNNTGTGSARDVWINSSLNPSTAILTVTVNTLGDIRVLVPRLGNRVYLHFHALGPGAYQATLQVEVRAGLRDGLRVDNSATLNYTDGNGNALPSAVSNTTVTVLAPRFSLTLSAGGFGVLPGGRVNYTYLLRALGNSTALNVWLNVTLPRDLLLVAQASSGAWTEASPGIESWHFSRLAPGSTETIQLELQVRPAAIPGIVYSLSGTLVYSDAYGLTQDQVVSNTENLQVLAPPAGFPWIYLLGLGAVVPVGIYLWRRLPGIQEVFVVYRDGSLLAHRSRSQTSDKDHDVLMAMFTAIQEFIKDSFSHGAPRELKGMNLGDLAVEIRRGEHLYLAVIFAGRTTAGLKHTMQALVARMERQYAATLLNWGGDMADVRGLGDLAAGLFPWRFRARLTTRE